MTWNVGGVDDLEHGSLSSTTWEVGCLGHWTWVVGHRHAMWDVGCRCCHQQCGMWVTWCLHSAGFMVGGQQAQGWEWQGTHVDVRDDDNVGSMPFVVVDVGHGCHH